MLSACVTLPSGPSVMVLPGTNKTFDQFREDGGVCQQYAQQAIGAGNPQQAALDSGTKSALVGTALGATAGAIIGSASGHGGSGAAVGAGTGLLVGSAAGSSAYEASGYGMQRRYDIAYMQCMYAKGNQVPVGAGYHGMSSRYPPPNQPPPPQHGSAPLPAK